MRCLKWVLCSILLLVGTAGPARPGDEASPAQRSRPVAAFNLDDFKGQVVLVDFWASWCKPCRKSLPWLNSMQQAYGKQGLQVVMVNLDQDPALATTMAAGIDTAIVQFHDPEGVLAARLELEGMPSSFLYDRSGELVSSHIGFLESDGPQREKAVLAVLESGNE